MLGMSILFLIISVNIFTQLTALNYQLYNENDADQVDELYAPYDEPSRYEKRSASNPYGQVEKQYSTILEKRAEVENPSKLSQLNDMSDEDIATALSKLSIREMQALDSFIDAEAKQMDSMLMKREATESENVSAEEEGGMSQQEEEEGEEDEEAQITEGGEPVNDGVVEAPTKRCNCPKCKEGQRTPAHSQFVASRHEREVPWNPYRNVRSQKMTADQRIEAKMNFLRDKNKRQLAFERLEGSVRQQNRRPGKRETLADEQRMPYFNSLIGPRPRAKRESTVEDSPQQQSVEHIKLLEESFPNPDTGSDLTVDDAEHIRVKRNKENQ